MDTVDHIRKFDGCSDTPKHVEEMQVDLFKKAGAAKRLQMAFSLSRSVINLSRRALKRAHPGLSDFQLKILFVENCYGAELAEKFKTCMQKKLGDVLNELNS